MDGRIGLGEAIHELALVGVCSLLVGVGGLKLALIIVGLSDLVVVIVVEGNVIVASIIVAFVSIHIAIGLVKRRQQPVGLFTQSIGGPVAGMIWCTLQPFQPSCAAALRRPWSTRSSGHPASFSRGEPTPEASGVKGTRSARYEAL